MRSVGFINVFIKRSLHSSSVMAKSKFEYVKDFESDDRLLPNCWIVVRIDGKGFHKFSHKHNFEKPNDVRALNLMNRAAVAVMKEFKDIVISYGESDEYSFVIRKDTEMYNRRASKFGSYINSLFSASYVFFWKDYFKEQQLKQIPCFDSRVILYPTDDNLKDYICWRQVDCHINNLYNTTFWALIQKGGLTNSEAEKRLCGTVTADKNEILFSEFNINYNDEPVMFKKGTILLRKRITNPRNRKQQLTIIPLHEDMTNPQFFTRHSEVLSAESGKEYKWPEDKPYPDFVRSQLGMDGNYSMDRGLEAETEL